MRTRSLEPYHGFSAVLFKTAADPKSPLNPFSAASEPVRAEATLLMRRVVEGSDAKPPADLAQKLPELPWLDEMAVRLFWIHDEAKGRAQTRKMIERTVEILSELLAVGSFPLFKLLRESALALLDELRTDTEATTQSKHKSSR